MRDHASKQGRSRANSWKNVWSLHSGPVLSLLPRKGKVLKVLLSLIGDLGSNWLWGWDMKTSYGRWLGADTVQLIMRGRGHVVLRSWNFMTVAVVTQNVWQLSSLWNNWQLTHHRVLGFLNLFLPSSVWDRLCSIHTRVIYSSEWCSNLSTEELTITMTPIWWFWRYGLKQLL